jgi:hypothetical protein
MTDPTKIPFLNAKVDATGNVMPITHADLPAAPGIANPAHVNHIANFFKAIGHGLKDVFVWAPRVATKTIEVIETSEKLTPEFLSSLKNILEDVALIVASSAAAAAQKGANVATDYNVLTNIEKLAGDFNAFYPILVKDFNALEGIIVAPAGTAPVTVAQPSQTQAEVNAAITHGLSDEGAAEIKAAQPPIITPEMLGATKDEVVGPASVPNVFVPKTPKPQ